MSIRGAILGLLAEAPMTGYEIAKRFDHALARVWPARSNQIYTELTRMEEAGLVKVIEVGARNARRFAMTDRGSEELLTWIRNRAAPDQQLRFDGLLKANFVFALPRDVRIPYLEGEREFWSSQAEWIENQMKHLPVDDSEETRARRLAAQAGIDLYRLMRGWAERYLEELRQTS